MNAATLPLIDWERVAGIVRAARALERESARAFARRLGVHHNVIHRVERSKSIKTDNYLALCFAMQLDPFLSVGWPRPGREQAA